MSKSLRNKRTKPKLKSRRRKYRGGTYYSYNRNPLRFTSITPQLGGKFTLNTRDNILPDSIVNAGRNFMYTASSNTMNGYYPPVNPDPSVQPINKSYLLL